MKGGLIMSQMSIDDAKALMSQSSLDNLKNITTVKPTINMDKKTSNDILMQALCKAVTDDVIHESSLDIKMIKLLNAETNSISQMKLGEILESIRKHQPNIVCVIQLMSGDMGHILNEWVFTGPIVSFDDIFEYVVRKFNITPQLIRDKLSKMLKPTIANNIGQFLVRYENRSDDDDDMTVSITTITRLVNMEDHLIMAEFKEM
jgi:hypothetical protein